MSTAPLPARPLGSTGRLVTAFGLGGEGVLRTQGKDEGALAVIAAAVERGVTYFDSARAYAGSEGYYGRYWSSHPGARERVFITSKSASRDAAGARRDLATTLSRLKVDHIDLWQIHDVRDERELAELGRRGGALEAFLEARASGAVRHIGVTGHHDPRVLLKAIRELPAETVLLPVNVAEAVLGGFLTEVVPEARRRKMGVIGMKVLGQGALLAPGLGLSAADLLRYALSEDVDTLILGCSTPAEVEANAAVASSAAPMTAGERESVLRKVRRSAGELAYYRGRF
jgi:aryl-alcohol dehydrogenase-like predicted oxidoreductase